MLSFKKALETVLDSACQLDTERVEFTCALNRVLAENVRSDMDIPPFNKSAMDGFACRRADLDSELTVIETIAAGTVPRKVIKSKQCSKIMTGAMIPEGADCVIMKEYVEETADNTIVFTGEKTADNICRKAEDIRAGDVVLQKGIKLKPQHIAVLASAGNTQPLVTKRPDVAVIATGSELVDPKSKPSLSQIRNTNSFQLAAQIEAMGAVATNYGIAGDTAEQIDSVFKEAIRQSDVVIVSGGVSVGDYDFVPGIFKQNNMDMLFEKIAIKPGKPTVFGTSGEKYCFGLPGNPVSTFVLFEILVKPFLYKLMGHDYEPLNIRIPSGVPLTSKKAKRQRWLPVAITDKGTVIPVEYHGSAHISSLCGADGLVSMDIGVSEIKKGTAVAVRLI
ncbi:MAG: molybdopterin molybdenumtransferase MoeA [Actinobacteria bacterium]|nr:molybdopterin molybdenumtransferase MoeA [Actinomycetota bacterium]